MSVSPQKIAAVLNKNPRTIWRWCELGIIPGAYRSRGGHWRIRRFKLREQLKVIERAKKFARVRTPLRKGNVIPGLKEMVQLLKRGAWKKLTKASVLLQAAHLDNRRLTDDTRLDKAITPRMNEAAQRSNSDLYIAAKLLIARWPSGKGLTACDLAYKLKISRMTLYRNYGKETIREVIKSVMRSLA